MSEFGTAKIQIISFFPLFERESGCVENFFLIFFGKNVENA